MKKVYLILLPTLLISGQIFAQDNQRELRPSGISFYGGGPTLFASASFDYFVIPTISLELGGGLFGVYSGARFHYKGHESQRKWTPYAGLLYAYYGEAVGVDQLFFLPLGYQYIGENGFNFAGEILIIGATGPFVIPVWPGIKFGYRF